MPTDIKPTRAQLQKEYRQLENFVLNPKVQTILLDAAKNKPATDRLKADPVKYLVEKKIKVPLETNISISFFPTPNLHCDM